jgi:hypothetical protein
VKSSITSNVDNRLDPKTRAETQYLDDLEGKIDDHIASEVRRGELAKGYQFLGEFAPHGATITEGHTLNDISSIRFRRDRNDPVKPVWTYHDPSTGEPIWILNDQDAELARLGYICPNCLSWQASTVSLSCKTRNDFSCGYVRSD